MSIEEYWNKFLQDSNLDRDTKYYDAFCFYGPDKETINRLTNLVLTGKKKATTSVFLDDEEYPHIGSYSIVLDINNEPVCIIQTVKIRVLRLKDMTWDIASKEGEGGNLETWFFDHNMMFTEESKQLGYKFTMDMPIFFEEFEVIYKG